MDLSLLLNEPSSTGAFGQLKEEPESPNFAHASPTDRPLQMSQSFAPFWKQEPPSPTFPLVHAFNSMDIEGLSSRPSSRARSSRLSSQASTASEWAQQSRGATATRRLQKITDHIKPARRLKDPVKAKREKENREVITSSLGVLQYQLMRTNPKLPSEAGWKSLRQHNRRKNMQYAPQFNKDCVLPTAGQRVEQDDLIFQGLVNRFRMAEDPHVRDYGQRLAKCVFARNTRNFEESFEELFNIKNVRKADFCCT